MFLCIIINRQRGWKLKLTLTIHRLSNILLHILLSFTTFQIEQKVELTTRNCIKNDFFYCNRAPKGEQVVNINELRFVLWSRLRALDWLFRRHEGRLDPRGLFSIGSEVDRNSSNTYSYIYISDIYS